MRTLLTRRSILFDRQPPFSFLLAATLVCMVAITMVITAVLDVRNARAEFRTQTEQKATLLASSVADLTANALYFRDIASLDEAAERVFRQGSLSFVRIVDESGLELTEVSHEGSEAEVRMERYAKDAEQRVRISGSPVFILRGNDAVIVHPIVVGAELLGIIEIGFEDTALDATVQAITRRRLWQTGVLGSVSILISIILTRRLTRSIGQLERGVEGISRGDLSTRVIPRGPREMKKLGEAFNSMALKLSLALEELEQEQANLERRVKARTLELEVLSNLGKLFPSDLNADNALEPFADLILRLLPDTSIVVAELDDEGHQLTVEAVYGEVPECLERAQNLPVQDSPWLEALALVEPTVQPGGWSRAEGKTDWGSLMIVPLTSRDDTVGMLVFVRARKAGFSLRDRNIGESIGTRISGALAEERERRALVEKAELRRIDNSRNEFLSNITHELKTPLTSVLAFTQILKRNKHRNLSSKQVQQLDVIDRNGRRLNILIEDLLDLSRIETDRFKLSKSPFKITELLDEIDLSFQPIFANKSQSYQSEVLFSDAWIDADKSRLAQVLSNLLSNASKYSESSTRVQLTAHIDGESLFIKVDDQGMGIRSEDLEKVCDLFFRAEEFEESTTPGTGVGLYVAKRIIELHHGTMRLKSETDSGTSVLIEIPGVTPVDPTPVTVQQDVFRTRFEELDISAG